MKTSGIQHLLTAAVFGAFSLGAQAQSDVPASPAIQSAPSSRPVPMERNWRFGLGLGYGARTNPLVLSDDIPLLVDVDIAWFGKRWFFDNFDLGYSLADTRWFTANAVARVNSDRVFFGKTNTKYVNFSIAAGGEKLPILSSGNAPGGGLAPETPQELKIPDRDYAIEAGLEMLMDGEWGQATLRGFHDVSGTHHGFEISADYSYRWTRGRLSLSPSVGIAWKSDELSDYYWGVNAAETGFTLAEYHPEGGLDFEAGFRASYYLTKNTRLAMSANYERLHASVALSPIVKEDHVIGYFAGVAWQF